jgi:hypothetical protein
MVVAAMVAATIASVMMADTLIMEATMLKEEARLTKR